MLVLTNADLTVLDHPAGYLTPGLHLRLVDLADEHPVLMRNRAVRARERGRDLIAALEQGLEEAGGAIVLIGASGRVEDASDFARQLLRAYIADDPARQAQLEDWIASGPGASTLAIEGSRGRLLVRSLERGGGETGLALLLTESRAGPLAVPVLLELGLTRREAQVLRLVATGKPNREIGTELGVAVGTVRKHLERIYAKLRVHSRTEAVTAALGAARSSE